ncbi:MAG: type VI secretion system tip protein VgrG [Bacteroidetes bacterium]|nr:type VI secretion system tip protein VgrG [Bacteroidota bacterium]
MSGSANIQSGGLVTFAIKVGGNVIPDENQVLSVEIESAVNRISRATISIRDGEASSGTFKASSSETFVPGAKITIEAGYDSKNQIIFKGIITGQFVQINNAIGSRLIVECRDEAIKMTVGRKTLTFAKQKDSDIISSIIGNYGGLSSEVTATTTQWPEQVQYYTSDWDFTLMRAEANGLIVTTVNGKLSVVKPDAETSSALTLSYGDNIYEINADLNSTTQLSSVQALSWDYKTQAVVKGESSNSQAGPGNLSSKKLSEVVGLSNYILQTSANLQQADLTNWTKAELVKSNYSKIRGEVKCQGNSLVVPGKYFTLKGLGTRFDGDHFIAGIKHVIAEGNWFTEVEFGISPNWFSYETDIMAPPASGLLPGTRGLFNATVKKIYEDPDNQYRIQIDIPLFGSQGEGIWARLTNFYSTSGAGAFFLPEVGDEVVVGFLGEDPRFPIILGSMYSSSKIKPFEGLDPNEKNSLKAIVSKQGIYIQFDDENKIFTIKTPGNNTIVVSDKDKKISIQDENSNSIELSSDGITMKSPKNISIEADQNVSIKGTQGVSIQSSPGDVQIKGTNVKINAEAEFSAQGSAAASVQGGGELTLKGAMVMIN